MASGRPARLLADRPLDGGVDRQRLERHRDPQPAARGRPGPAADQAVIGFDDQPGSALEPSLTTVRQPLDEIGGWPRDWSCGAERRAGGVQRRLATTLRGAGVVRLPEPAGAVLRRGRDRRRRRLLAEITRGCATAGPARARRPRGGSGGGDPHDRAHIAPPPAADAGRHGTAPAPGRSRRLFPLPEVRAVVQRCLSSTAAHYGRAVQTVAGADAAGPPPGPGCGLSRCSPCPPRHSPVQVAHGRSTMSALGTSTRSACSCCAATNRIPARWTGWPDHRTSGGLPGPVARLSRPAAAGFLDVVATPDRRAGAAVQGSGRAGASVPAGRP